MSNDIVLIGNHSTRDSLLKDVHFYVYHRYQIVIRESHLRLEKKSISKRIE